MIRSRRQPAFAANQRGWMLISALLALSIAAAALTMYVQFQSRNILIKRSNIEGAQASQFAIGLRGFVAAGQSNPALIPGGTMAGVDWLKSPGCGGLPTNPVAGYVPCSYTGGTYGPLYRTTFTHTLATNNIEARTTFIVPPSGNDPRNVILMAERVAQAAMSGQALPNNGMFFEAFANTPPGASGPGPAAANPGPNAGRVVMLATNAPSNDIWLRTDGTNRMLANLNMGNFSIGNAVDGNFSGDVSIDGQAEIDTGLKVGGASDLAGGVVTNEIALTSIGKYVTEGIYDAQVYAGASAYNIPKQDCSQAGGNPGIYAAIQGTGTPNFDGSYAGDAIYGARVDVTDAGGHWTVRPVLRTTQFNLRRDGNDLVFSKQLITRSPSDMRILVLRRCR